MVESSAMISSQGRGCGNWGDRGSHPQCSYWEQMGHTQENSYSLHDFPGNRTNLSMSKKSKINAWGWLPRISQENHK